MSQKILVIGGAGFIGSHLIDDLLSKGHEIVVLDSLVPQVHGERSDPPDYLTKNIQFIKDDVRNKIALQNALEDIEVVYHLAAKVGIGQSMYQIEDYVGVNSLGTASLLDFLVNKPNNVKKLVVASSNSTYGEGRYICKDCGKVNPMLRDITQLELGDWKQNCPKCNQKVEPIGTDEDKPQESTSIYALGKMHQEHMSLLIGRTYGINTTALRFFNVYGTRQALSNPYTGLCAIFSTNLLCGNPPTIYEDGQQTRDLVHVKDICQALTLSLEKTQSRDQVFNVGTGAPIKIVDIANILAENINPKIKPTITNKFRPGDIRHCYADISKIKSSLGYEPKFTFKEGIKELVEWVKSQQGKIVDKSDKANAELKEKGLMK